MVLLIKIPFYSIIKTLFKILLITIFFIPSAISDDLYEGQYIKGSIQNAFKSKLNFYLPPGDWEVNEVETEGNDMVYKNVTMYSDAGDYMYISVPVTKSPPAYRWRAGGLKKCDGVKKRNIYTFAVQRGRVEATLCVSKWVGDDAYEWADVQVNMRTTSGNLKWAYVNFSTDYNLLKQDVPERERKNIAEQALKGLLDGFNGKDPSGTSQLLRLFDM